MDRRTMLVALFGIAFFGSVAAIAIYASVQNTKIRADTSITKAQEHTRRAEGRHDLVDALGWLRDWKSQHGDR